MKARVVRLTDSSHRFGLMTTVAVDGICFIFRIVFRSVKDTDISSCEKYIEKKNNKDKQQIKKIDSWKILFSTELGPPVFCLHYNIIQAQSQLHSDSCGSYYEGNGCLALHAGGSLLNNNKISKSLRKTIFHFAFLNISIGRLNKCVSPEIFIGPDGIS